MIVYFIINICDLSQRPPTEDLLVAYFKSFYNFSWVMDSKLLDTI